MNPCTPLGLMPEPATAEALSNSQNLGTIWENSMNLRPVRPGQSSLYSACPCRNCVASLEVLAARAETFPFPKIRAHQSLRRSIEGRTGIQPHADSDTFRHYADHARHISMIHADLRKATYKARSGEFCSAILGK